MAMTMAGYHDAHLTDDPSRPIVWKEIARYLSGYVPDGGDVLEIGAGYCAWINAVRATRRTAVDIWPGIERHAAPDVRTIVMDVSRELPSLGTGRFDAVLASNVLEHFEPDAVATVASDVLGVLKPGGRLLVIQPNFAHAFARYFDDYTHRSVFTHVSLPALLRSRGFTVERVEPRFLPYSMQGSRLPIRGWLVRTYLQSPFKPMSGQMLVVAVKR